MGGELCGLRANGGARMLVTMQQQSSPGCGVLLPRCCRSAKLTATERQRKKKYESMGSTWWESYGCSSEPAAPNTNTAAPAGGKEKKWVMCIPLNSALSDGQRHRKALNMTLSITTAMQAELAASKETEKSIFRVSQMCLTWHQNATYPKVTSFMKGHITPELNHRFM